MISINMFLNILMVLVVMIFALLIALVVVQHMERKDLYTRIMSGSLGEYKGADSKPKAPIDAHRAVLERWRKISTEE